MPDKSTELPEGQDRHPNQKSVIRNNKHSAAAVPASAGSVAGPITLAAIAAVFLISFFAFLLFRQTEGEEAQPAFSQAFVWSEAPMPWNIAASLRRCEEARLTAWPPSGYVMWNSYASLSVPTLFTRIGEDYFLVDCYHDQILVSDAPERPLTQWRVMSDSIDRGHTIAGDGVVYLADDTENNRILVYRKINGNFYFSQAFHEIGVRPHFILYDENDRRFYALSSMTGQLYVFYRDDVSARVYLEEILEIPELAGVYVRSFTKEEDDIYFPACDGRILRVDLKSAESSEESFMEAAETWAVPDEIAGLIQLTRIDGYFYITVSTDINGDASAAALIRVRELSDLAEGAWEDISDLFGTDGTPYYITSVDGWYYLTRHGSQGLWRFKTREGQPVDIEYLHS